MKFKEIASAPVKEQELKIRQNRSEIMTLLIKKSSGQLEKPHAISLLRKENARRLTAIKQKAK